MKPADLQPKLKKFIDMKVNPTDAANPSICKIV